jgi:FADH2 O2-dependent halogenase
VKETCEVAVVGSGFAGSLLARILSVLGYEVALLEKGTHPRFAIGESSTPLANLSLERIATRYGLSDCYDLAAHGRWVERFPDLRRGLKRGFTYYRHHPGRPFENRGFDSERLLVAASPDDAISDSHWLRADVDHHFVREAIAAGVSYADRTAIEEVEFSPQGARLSGTRDGSEFELRARFVIDASGPGGFLARQMSIPSGLTKTHTRSSLVYSHFEGARPMCDVVPGLPEGPYPDDWAAVHHLVDEGWMYSLRFDDGITSAGFLLTPAGLASLGATEQGDADSLWRAMLARYPTIADAFGNATALRPTAYVPLIQHRLTRAAGEGWLLMPHAYAFVDPLFSTGIAWSLRAVERIALAFESAGNGRLPEKATLGRYESTLAAEADQIDLMVAGAYESMAHFDLFAAQAMLYFATVSFAEASQRMKPDDSIAWNGFMGVGDAILNDIPRQSLLRLKEIIRSRAITGSAGQRAAFVDWISAAIAPRNIAGLADPTRQNLYPVDFDALVAGHAKLGLGRDQVIAGLPSLRGMSPRPEFAAPASTPNLELAAGGLEPASFTPQPDNQL